MKRILLLLVLFLCSLSARAAQDIPVMFGSGDLILYGTLSVPSGEGPFPVVVLVHGSGPQDRDETFVVNDATTACLYPGMAGKTLRAFRDIANSFAAKGIAVLRYDKQTYTYGQELDPKTISPYDIVRDIHSAVEFLKTRTEIDASSIMLLGHSEGGNFVPLVAKERTDIAVVIGLAAPARAIDSILVEQVRYIARTCGDSAQGEAQANQIRQVFNLMRSGQWDANTPVLGVYPAYWLEWIGIGDSAVIAYNNISQPTLFLQGTADYNVTTVDSDRFATQISREPVDVFVLPGLNHQFTAQGVPEVAPVVVDTIYDWLQKIGVVTSVEEPGGNSEAVVVYTGGVPALHLPKAAAPWAVRIVDVLGRTVKECSVEQGQVTVEGTGWYGYTAVSGGRVLSGTFVVRQ